MKTWQKVVSSANDGLISTVIGIAFLYLFIVSGMIAGLPLGLGALIYTFFKLRRAKVEIKKITEEL